MHDPFDLQRFVDAQRGVYEQALDELHRGRKTSHWMWFVFPQLRGLGLSATAQTYGITGVGEARAYLAHGVLGPRLVEVAEAVHAVAGRTAHDIFGSPDDMKLRSSMTLFDAADPAAPQFRAVLDKYFAGQRDDRTLQLLNEHA